VRLRFDVAICSRRLSSSNRGKTLRPPDGVFQIAIRVSQRNGACAHESDLDALM